MGLESIIGLRRLELPLTSDLAGTWSGMTEEPSLPRSAADSPKAPVRLFATAARGLEPLLADELRAQGATDVKETRAGCGFVGTLETAYRVCLWSRLASRVLLPLAEVGAVDADELYEGVRALSWEHHLAATGTLAVDFTTSGSSITHTHYGALRVKDAIVDRFRESTGVRPSVDIHYPDLRIYVHAHHGSLGGGHSRARRMAGSLRRGGWVL